MGGVTLSWEGWSGSSLTSGLAELHLRPDGLNPNLVLLQNLGRTLTEPLFLGFGRFYSGRARKAPAHLSLSWSTPCQLCLLQGHLHGHRQCPSSFFPAPVTQIPAAWPGREVRDEGEQM